MICEQSSQRFLQSNFDMAVFKIIFGTIFICNYLFHLSNSAFPVFSLSIIVTFLFIRSDCLMRQ